MAKTKTTTNNAASTNDNTNTICKEIMKISS